MGWFSKKNVLRPKKYGKRLAWVMREVLREDSKPENLTFMRAPFENLGVPFIPSDYMLFTAEMYKVMVMDMVAALPALEGRASPEIMGPILEPMIEAIMEELPNVSDDFVSYRALNYIKVQRELSGSDRRLFTIARVFAQDYIDALQSEVAEEDVLGTIMIFQNRAQAFERVLEAFQREHRLRA